MDQAPSFDGSEVAGGQDGQERSDGNPDTNTDINTETGIVPDGTCRVIARHGGVSLSDGANVHIWTWLGGNNYNQRWSFQLPKCRLKPLQRMWWSCGRDDTN